jgi:hypothetical protein
MGEPPKMTPEITSDEATSPLRKAVRMTVTRLNGASQCAVGDDLKQQYESALELWKKLSIPPVDPFEEGEISALAASQLREEALKKRNAAANRMYLHRADCSLCRRRR